MNNKKMLVTSALPYANGPLHLGHMLEHIQTDIWVRAQKLMGNDCIAVCGEDAHGTPIMLKAQSLGISPEELIKDVRQSHEKDFADFSINYDHYHTTHSEENKELASFIYLKLKERGDIIKKTIKQAFDPEKKMFLPDRFIKGECPKCGAEDQYGDNCESCGATYSPTDLKSPKSVLSGCTPIEKESEHFFFDLPNYEIMLKEWTHSGHLQKEITNKLEEWFEAGLKEWDISRDAPYFGFPIPGEKDKYFYVWMDAPIGYIAAFKAYCEKNPDVKFEDYWHKGASAELYHFIGKDIMYFHALFWPAVLHGADLRTPTNIFTHGFLTIDGKKMSKSRGTFIKARTYLEHLNPEYLRYYLAAKSNSNIDDIDLNLEDFVNKINADLVGKVVNIASRTATFITKRFDGKLSAKLDNENLVQEFTFQGEAIAKLFTQREYSQAIKAIMNLAAKANVYIDEKKPWVMIKDESLDSQVQEVCTTGLNLFKLLITYLKPILPGLALKVEEFLNCTALDFSNAKDLLLNVEINKFKPLMTRIETTQIDALKKAAQKETQTTQAQVDSSQDKDPNFEPIAPEIEFSDFSKLDLRVALITSAQEVEGADKLLKLELDLGAQTKHVIAGIKSAYKPEDLEGKLTVMVANLKPRKMRFGTSEGMVLAAGPGGKDLFILNPDSGAKPGMRVK